MVVEFSDESGIEEGKSAGDVTVTDTGAAQGFVLFTRDVDGKVNEVVLGKVTVRGKGE